MFCKKRVLKNFTKFSGKHRCQSPFYNKVAGRGLQLYEKKRLRCFPVNFVKFLRTPIFIEHLLWLLLNHSPTPSFSIEMVKSESDELSLRMIILFCFSYIWPVALKYSDIGVFWLHWYSYQDGQPYLEVANNRLLYQQVNIPTKVGSEPYHPWKCVTTTTGVDILAGSQMADELSGNIKIITSRISESAKCNLAF